MARWTGSTLAVCAYLGALALAAPLTVRPAAAQELQPEHPQQDRPAVNRPGLADRLVRLFDFEDPFTGNDLPYGWYRAQDDPDVPRHRPGYPLFNKAELDRSVARSGTTSIRLPTHGQNASLRLAEGVLPVFAGGDYRVTAWVRTGGLRHSRARMVIRLLDPDSQPIPGSERRTRLVGPEAEENWREVSVDLPGVYPDAAFLQIDLELIQPAFFADDPLPKHQVWEQDYEGAAWFDDVAIHQVPRVAIRVDGPGNVVMQPQRPTVHLEVRDLTGQDLRARMTVTDAAGRIVDAREHDVLGAGSEPPWTPNIDRFGWYTVDLELLHDDEPVTTRSLTLAYVPESRTAHDVTAGARPGAAGSPDRDRFGVYVRNVPADAAAFLPRALEVAGLGACTLAVELRDDAPAVVQRTDPLVRALLGHWRRVAIALESVTEKNAGAGPSGVLAALVRTGPERGGAPDDDGKGGAGGHGWGGQAAPLLDAWGQSITRWQIGPPGDDGWLTDGGDLALIESTLSRLVPGPVLTMPWSIESPLPEGAFSPALGGVCVLATDMADADALAAFLSAWDAQTAALPDGQSPPELTLLLGPPGDPPSATRAAGMAKRIVEFWAAQGGNPRASVSLCDPWSWRNGEDQARDPRPELAAMRTLADQLVDRRIVGTIPVGPDGVCYVLAPADSAPADRSGALVAWSNAADDPVLLRARLGPGGVTLTGCFGNRSTAAPITEAAAIGDDATLVTKMHRIELSSSPVFIEGIDLGVARLLSSVRLEPPLIKSIDGEHEARIVLTNPWDTPLRGRLAVVAPGGLLPDGRTRDRTWRITPRAMDLVAESGETITLPIVMDASSTEPTGPKEMVLEMQFAADRAYDRFRTIVPFAFGLESMSVHATARRVPDAAGPDLLIEVTMANLGDEPITLDVRLFPPPGRDVARLSGRIPSLAPGEQAAHRFLLPAIPDDLAGERFVVRITDQAASRRLTATIEVPARSP